MSTGAFLDSCLSVENCEAVCILIMLGKCLHIELVKILLPMALHTPIIFYLTGTLELSQEVLYYYELQGYCGGYKKMVGHS